MSAPANSVPPKFYICHADHEHDRTFTENLFEYLTSRGALSRSITLGEDGYRAELQLCFEDRATAVIGYNSQLDHSWVSSGSFLAAAERERIPVIQWILDHPSAHWSDFHSSNSANSRFLLNSEHAQQYFQTYCLPDAVTAITGGVGPNQRSRIADLTKSDFLQRSVSCMIPLGLRRLRSIQENEEFIGGLDGTIAEVVRAAVATAKFDLIEPLQKHITSALGTHAQSISPQTFNSISWTVEHSVQQYRRLKIFSHATKYPVLIQSDATALPFLEDADTRASFAKDVGMQLTLARMRLCRAVLSVSPLGDMIHDRTMNALNAGCVAIAEDSPATKGILKHKENALLFRYEDDSLDECLDIVCNKPDTAYEIAQAGFRIRDHERLRFGHFHNVIDLAHRTVEHGANFTP